MEMREWTLNTRPPFHEYCFIDIYMNKEYDIRSLSPTESLAMLDAVERFWKVMSEDRTYDDVLMEVGLVEVPFMDAYFGKQ